MVDVVAAKAGAHELLEQVGLFVAALGRAEAGERLRAVRVAQLRQAAAGELERLFPGRLAEDVEDAVRVHRRVGALGRVGAADQRHAQALRVVRVVEAVAALDAQALVVGRAVAAVDEEDLVVLDVVGQLAADAAVRAERLHLLVGDRERDVARRHQRAGRARLHALAAGDAGRGAHRVVHVEDDLRVVAAEGEADDVVDLLVAAGANAARALDARRQVDRHRRMREVGRDRRRAARSAACRRRACAAHSSTSLWRVYSASGMSDSSSSRTSFCDLSARSLSVVTFIPARRRAAARRREDALAGDLDHARAAVADLVEAGLVAKARDRDAFGVGDLDQRAVGAAPRSRGRSARSERPGRRAGRSRCA